MTNLGTETAFRHDHCKHFQKSVHLLGSEVSWCDHRLAQTPKEAFSEVKVHTGTTQVDFKVGPPATCTVSPPDHLITIGKDMVKKSFEKMKKKWNLFVSLIDLIISSRIAGPDELFSSDLRACARSPRWATRCSFGLLKSVAAAMQQLDHRSASELFP